MVLERPELFHPREWLLFATLMLLLFAAGLGMEYRRYAELTRFDDAVAEVLVQDQYLKRKGAKRYYVLKLRGDDGVTFYTTGPPELRDLRGYRLEVRMQTKRLEYLNYLKGFFAYTTILKVYPEREARTRLAGAVARRHLSPEAGQIYAALFTASPMEKPLREKLAALGVSHLLAISGFHLGVLGFVLFWLFRLPVTALQSRYAPYLHRGRLLFVLSALPLLGYLWFLDFVPSLLRAFVMMLVGYVLYDRGLKVLSLQTLAVAVLLILAFWPRLLFSLGFWLSVGGVFSILLFIRHFSHWNKMVLFGAIHLWVYLMMLPVSLWIFGIFSPLHPLSVLWSMGFILFYPLALALHLFGAEGVLYGVMEWFLSLAEVAHATVPGWAVGVQFLLAFAALFSRLGLWLLFGASLAVFAGAVYQVA